MSKRIPVTFWRRAAQVAFLVLFLFLFRQTDYHGTDEIPYAVNIFFRWDPLVAASALLAAKTLLVILLPALVVVLATLVLGRFFCGWVCPLGTLLDLAHYVIPPRSAGTTGRYLSIKYVLLGLILVGAVFGLPLVGYFDPFSILVRGLTLVVDPALNVAVTAPFDLIYRSAPAWVSGLSEPVYAFLRANILPFRQTVFNLAILSLVILAAVFALERLERRFWCRNVCPLGALLGLLSRVAPLRWHPGIACHSGGCHTCSEVCRMGAIGAQDGKIAPEACTLCLDCVEACPRGIISFKFKSPAPKPAPVAGVSRRVFLGTLAAGLVLPATLKVRAAGKAPDPSLIRPPGALEETQFLERCVRCGECMKVCIGNALHPTLLEAGVEGMFSPHLVPRVGYCEFNCTLCGQVCPTGAIQKLTLEEKQKTVIGRAWFDKDRCLPWARGTPCLVCEEHCPVPDKAIKLREAVVLDQTGAEVTLKQPYVVDALCIGCGICENKCPLPGRAAVLVTREGESRDPKSAEGFLVTGY